MVRFDLARHRKWMLMLPLLLGLVAMQSLTAQAKTPLYSHELPPFSYTLEDKMTGFAVDMVEAVFSQAQREYELFSVPFARGLKDTEEKSSRVFFPVARTPEREQMFHWVGPIVKSEVHFYQHRQNLQRFSHIHDHKKLTRVAVSANNTDHVWLQNNGFELIVATKNQTKSLQLLVMGRVDLAPSSNVFAYHFCQQQSSIVCSIKKTGIKLYDSTLYIAFSKDHSLEELKKLQQVLDNFKKTAKYRGIMRQYLGEMSLAMFKN